MYSFAYSRRGIPTMPYLRQLGSKSGSIIPQTQSISIKTTKQIIQESKAKGLSVEETKEAIQKNKNKTIT